MADEATNQCPQCGADLPADAPQGICPKCLLKQGLQPDTQAQNSATPPGGFVPPEPAQIAGDFPQMEIIELLGRGGMGVVYKARQKQLDRIVALKILPPDIGKDPAFAERFTREAKALAKLNHPQIVTIHDIGKTQSGLYYFVMEYVDGTDLRQVLQTGNLSPQESLAIVPQICQALQYAHDEGIVHRDIKPENILLDTKGRVKIADFGLARLLDKPAAVYTLTAVGQKMGTPHYMAPEQIAGSHNIDHRADIYSLGVVFYEMLTGQLPLGRFDPPSKKVQVDVRLDEIVLRTLEQEPARRYQHVRQVQTDIETITVATSLAKAVRKKDLTPERALREQIKRPAIGLLISAFFSCLFVFLYVLGNLATLEENVISAMFRELAEMGYIYHNGMILSVIFAVVIIWAMIKMMNLQSYRLAVAAGILAMIPTSIVCLVTFPLGLWTLIVLAKQPTKDAFQKHAVAMSPTKAVRKKELTPEQALRKRVKWPAIGLLIAGCFNWFFVIYNFHLLATFEEQGLFAALQHFWNIGWQVLPSMVLSVIVAGVIIVAAIKMMNLQSYHLAMAGGILAMSPTSIVWFVTFPFGLWTLIVLAKQPVKDAFQKHAVAMSPAKTVRKKELIPEQALRKRVKWPAIGLLIAGCFKLFFIIYTFYLLATFEEQGLFAALQHFVNMGWQVRWSMVLMVLMVIFAGVIIVAAIKMMNLQSYHLAMAGGILAMSPTSIIVWVVTGPFGLWALIVLSRQDVKAAFADAEKT